MALSDERVISLVKKLLLQAESEEKLGNSGASILFAQKAQKLLADYKLEHPIMEATPEFQVRLGKTIMYYPFYRVNAKTKDRQVWYEDLAKVVAELNYCTVENNGEELEREKYGHYYDRYNKNEKGTTIVFTGTDLDRTVATFVFEKLANVAFLRCKNEMIKAKKAVGGQILDIFSKSTTPHLATWPGDETFEKEFHKGFREQISSAFSAKKALTGNFDENEVASPKGNGFSISNLGRKAGEKISEVVVDTNPVDLPKAPNYAGDVYVCIDVSGSMCGDRLEQAKKGTIEYFKDAIAKDFNVGLISFESEIEHLIGLTKNSEKFNAAVMSMRCKGSTNMAGAIEEATNRFPSAMTRRIIVIATDGVPDSTFYTIEMANKAKLLGIEIQTIGTEGADWEFLKEIASNPRLAIGVGNAQLGEGIRKMAGLLTA